MSTNLEANVASVQADLNFAMVFAGKSLGCNVEACLFVRDYRMSR